jgi:hypothetical protein
MASYTLTARGSFKPTTQEGLAEFRALQRQANRHLDRMGTALLVCDGIIGVKTHNAVENILGMSVARSELADNTGRYTNDLSMLAESSHLPVVECPSTIVTKYVRPMPTVNPDGSVSYQTEGIMGIPYWALAVAAAGGYYYYAQKKKGVQKPFKVI